MISFYLNIINDLQNNHILYYFIIILILYLLNIEIILNFHFLQSMEYFDKIYVIIMGLFLLIFNIFIYLVNNKEYFILFDLFLLFATIFLYIHNDLVKVHLSFIFDFLLNNLYGFLLYILHFINDYYNPMVLKINSVLFIHSLIVILTMLVYYFLLLLLIHLLYLKLQYFMLYFLIMIYLLICHLKIIFCFILNCTLNSIQESISRAVVLAEELSSYFDHYPHLPPSCFFYF